MSQPSPRPSARRSAARGRRLVAVACATACAAAALTASAGAARAAAAVPAAVPAAVGTHIWVPSYSGNTVAEVDAATGATERTFTVGAHPLIARATKDGSKVYVDNTGLLPSSVSVIDTRTGTVKTIPMDFIPFVLLLSPDDRYVYALLGNSTIKVIDTATDTVVKSYPTGNVLPASMEMSPDGNTLYVSYALTASITAFDAHTGAQVKPEIGAGGTLPLWFTLSRDGRRIYSLNVGNNTVTVVDTAAWKVVGTIDMGPDTAPVIGQESPDGTKLYITDFGSHDVAVVDTATLRVVKRIPVPGLAAGVDVDSDGTGYITDWGPGSAQFQGYFVGLGAFVTAAVGSPPNTGPGDLIAFDTRTDTILRTTPTVVGPFVTAFSHDG